MATRQYTNFTDFPGQIVGYTYQYPILYTIDERQRIRTWQAIIRAVPCDAAQHTAVNWDPAELAGQLCQITAAHLAGEELPNGYCVETYIETGILDGQLTRHCPTRYATGVNQGRKNYRTALQKAMIDTRDAYIKRQEAGGRQSIEQAWDTVRPFAVQPVKQLCPTAGMCPIAQRYYPMLAHKYTESKKYVKWPAYIQPKLDGVRCIVYVDGPNDTDVVHAYSRKLNEFPAVPHITARLKPYLQDLFDQENCQSIYLDGEIYEHGAALQDITGQVRQHDAQNVEHLMQYHIYDCFYPLELDTPYVNRAAQLDVLRDAVQNHANDALYIKFVPRQLVANEEEAMRAFHTMVADGYEGAMLRNAAGVYLADPARSSTRSRDLLKIKAKETEEFKIVGFAAGKGRDAGAIIWILETAAGERFNCTPKESSLEERRRLYQEALRDFTTTYMGRMMTVEYETLSNRGVPLRAKAVGIRDYE